MSSIMTEITVGDKIGISLILFGIFLCVISVVWLVKDKGRSLGPMNLSILAALSCWIGTFIARVS